MENQVDAIYTKFAELTESVHNALWLAVVGRMFFGEAEPEAEYPFIVCSLTAETLERTLEKKYPKTRFQFSTFSTKTSGIEAEQIADKINDLYGDDNLTMSIDDHTMIRMDFEISTVNKVPSGLTGIETLWQVDSDFILNVLET